MTTARGLSVDLRVAPVGEGYPGLKTVAPSFRTQTRENLPFIGLTGGKTRRLDLPRNYFNT